jgi:hypothetical protein
MELKSIIKNNKNVISASFRLFVDTVMRNDIAAADCWLATGLVAVNDLRFNGGNTLVVELQMLLKILETGMAFLIY